MRNPIEGFGPRAYSQDITTANSLGVRLHVITAPELMHDVLSRQAEKFPKAPIDGRIFSTAMKEGLLSVEGGQWKRQRRVLAPIFRPALLSAMAPMITQSIEAFTSRIGQGAQVELREAMSDLTFDVLAKALLGNAEGVERASLHKAMQRGLDSVGTIRPDDLLPLPKGTPRPISPAGYLAIRRVKKAADTLIAQRKRHPQDDLVGLLTGATDPHSGKPLSAREQRDNLTGFFIAGHETTALTLCWALYLLGRVPTIQERVLSEVKAAYPGGAIPHDCLSNLPLTRAVIDETQRLFPPAALMGRQCAQDTQIGGRDIVKGDILTLAIYVMHRREAFWSKPKLFDPDRFLENPSLNAKGSAFMPFGGGPRICVAAGFARMEAMMALATIIRDFKVEVADNVYPRPKLTVTLRPEGGIPARLTRRN